MLREGLRLSQPLLLRRGSGGLRVWRLLSGLVAALVLLCLFNAYSHDERPGCGGERDAVLPLARCGNAGPLPSFLFPSAALRSFAVVCPRVQQLARLPEAALRLCSRWMRRLAREEEEDESREQEGEQGEGAQERNEGDAPSTARSFNIRRGNARADVTTRFHVSSFPRLHL